MQCGLKNICRWWVNGSCTSAQEKKNQRKTKTGEKLNNEWLPSSWNARNCAYLNENNQVLICGLGSRNILPRFLRIYNS